MPATAETLDAIASYVKNDPGLAANIVSADINGGAAAARLMNDVIETAIAATGVNEDGRLTPDDLREISDYIRANENLYDQFVEGHGDDEGSIETGFHLVQGDGGAYQFQGRNFVNTVADAIYHVGFTYSDGRFVNEDGNANETVDDVAGWMNYFVNGENVVYGTDDSETLNSGHYSFDLEQAAAEIFEAGGGNDKIWAGDGDDVVYGGTGDDTSAGGGGDDTLKGEAGADTLWGQEGDDLLDGGGGDDRLGGGDGNDKLYGDAGADTLAGEDGDDRAWGGEGNDKLWGNLGADRLYGDAGDDTMGGGRGADVMFGGDGNDTMWGEEGRDRLVGGAGDDRIGGQEDNDTVIGGEGDDTLFGDAGKDLLAGQDGEDKLNGGDGDDRLVGGADDDELIGGEGRDVYIGGSGADVLRDWEDEDAVDVFRFNEGDSGVVAGKIDVIEGFTSGIDKINLASFDALTFVGQDDFAGNDAGEVRFDGDYVRIDADGDGTEDSVIEVKWVDELVESDFIL